MRARAVVSVLLSVMLIAAGPAAAAKKGLRLTEHVPKDPVLAWILTVADLATNYDGILQFVSRVADEVEVDTFNAKLAEFEATVGCSVRDDLLAQIGPEIGLERVGSFQLRMPIEPAAPAGPRARDQEGTRFEQESLEFHERVRNGYLKLAEDEPDRWRILDATRSVAEISEAVWDHVSGELSSSSSSVSGPTR